VANNCGECDICCKVFNIPEINSPKGEDCQFCDSGCRVYETRPQVCIDFECAYLVNNWREELRPDKCGVVVRQLRKNTIQAIRWRDKVTDLIIDQLEFIKVKYRVKIQYEDGRAKDEQNFKNIPANRYNIG